MFIQLVVLVLDTGKGVTHVETWLSDFSCKTMMGVNRRMSIVHQNEHPDKTMVYWCGFVNV